jgi:hypothetical protein
MSIFLHRKVEYFILRNYEINYECPLFAHIKFVKSPIPQAFNKKYIYKNSISGK